MEGGEDLKILVADDDPDLRDLLTEAVRGWGFRSHAAKDGSDALRKISQGRYDIVLCDLKMPGLDGLELLARAKDLNPDLLFVVITGFASVESAVKAIEAGAYDYIAKPFRLDELMVLLKNASVHVSLMKKNRALSAELEKAREEIEALRGSGRDTSSNPGEGTRRNR